MSRSTTEVSPQTGRYVLPAPPRGHGDLVIVPPQAGGMVLRRGRDVARRLGARFELLSECQDQFLAELRNRLETLDVAIAEDSRARLKGLLREANELLGWVDAVQADFRADSQLAASGSEPIDVADLCRDLAGELGTGGSPVVVTGSAPLPWWGDVVCLAEVLRLGLALIAERTGGHGLREIEVGGEGGCQVRIAGAGEPRDSVDPQLVQHFRDACEGLGILVSPDPLRPGSAGMVLRLP